LPREVDASSGGILLHPRQSDRRRVLAHVVNLASLSERTMRKYPATMKMRRHRRIGVAMTAPRSSIGCK
jgi:hypothetical protein